MNAIVIMAREPKPNKVKTRLTPELDPETAAKLYYNFILDRIDQVGGIKGAQHFIAFTPEDAVAYFREIVPTEFNLIPQKGNDLGERLENVSKSILDQGFKKVVIMDSDSPNLPTWLIEKAFERLESEKIVLGSCEDGGYYLIGLRSKIPNIFRDIPWSTPNVISETLKRAYEKGIEISMLDKWYDVDTYNDVLHLKTDLNDAINKNKNAYFCKNTYQFLTEILK